MNSEVPSAAPLWMFWRSTDWRHGHGERIVSLALFALLFVYILFSFRLQGISNDEEVQHVYGRLLLDFYQSGLTDRAAFEYRNLYLYGGFFDLIAAAIERFFPSLQIWEARHLLSALFGLAGFFAVWKTTRHLAGEKAAIVAVVLLALTGAWTGAMFTHTKDVPFATCMAWALYYTVRVLERLPRPPESLVLKLGTAIGCAFGLRVGAVFAVFYLLAGLCLLTLLRGGRDGGSRWAFFWRSLFMLLPAAVPALVLMGFFWPWSVMEPENLYLAVTKFSHFAFNLDTIIDGQVLQNGAVPGTYLATYLLVRLPELFLAALALALLFALARLPRLRAAIVRDEAMRWLPVALAATVPLCYTLLAHPPLYNGIRHFTFLLPVFAVVGAWGVRALWRAAWAWRLEPLVMVAAAALAAFHLTTLVRLYPYEYVYYNQLVGGLPGAAGRWEMDYWSASLKEAIPFLSARIRDEQDVQPRQYSVAVCAETLQAAVYLPPQFEVTRDWTKADFFLSTTHMNCQEVLRGEKIGEIDRLGVPLMIVLDRRQVPPELRRPLR
jgi:hypothetical protein